MSKKGIIFETLNEVKSMDISKSGDGFMHLSGVFGVCGVRNNNQRVYETKNYAKMVESMQERLKKAPIPGELEHPQSMNITTENISHRIDSIKIDEKGVVSGEITLLNTPKGKIAQAIVEGGLPLFISSRASGQVDKNGNVTLETLQTYDLVGSPGFSQAELHLNENQCFESINESMCFIGDVNDTTEINENEDMTNDELKNIQEQIEELRNQIDYLTEQNNLLQEELDEKSEISEDTANGIQDWIVEEFAPEVQKWIVEEYSQKVQDWVVEEYSAELQKWLTENYSKRVQEWIIEEFAPEVQNWVVEEYSQKVQDWVVEEYSNEVQKWITNDYSENLQKWLMEHFTPEVITKQMNESKSDKLGMIDSILEMLDNKQIQKPVYGRKAQMLNEDINTPKYIAEMPNDIRVKYDLSNDQVKESISRRARLYDWSKPNAIQNFWEHIDFDKLNSNMISESVKPSNVIDAHENAIRESIRNWRNR